MPIDEQKLIELFRKLDAVKAKVPPMTKEERKRAFLKDAREARERAKQKR